MASANVSAQAASEAEAARDQAAARGDHLGAAGKAVGAGAGKNETAFGVGVERRLKRSGFLLK